MTSETHGKMVSLRGIATIKGKILYGHLFFHQGYDSEFKATRDRQ